MRLNHLIAYDVEIASTCMENLVGKLLISIYTYVHEVFTYLHPYISMLMKQLARQISLSSS